ncbi:MAG: hypothetical protein HOE50_05705 [Chloroflexi bacterium]|jgi:magnesium transporter|nr:hypothetical protein [Chloroflexota bacterium]MBT4142617.1 hypothetical protein [Chloroflexota bacterium]MBT4943659.1 hypothetical protein [Chloroflexota bacterium]MBT5475254.1 hypothetical protein [Chloroflexota bacterium]MBT6707691.1 hypothetical protein [Chloroflexota bacterium]
MVIDNVPTHDAQRLFVREALLAIAQGVVIADVIAGLVLLSRGDVYLALLLKILIAALPGVIIPFVLRAIKADLAASTSVFLTTVTGMVGIAAYIALATVFLSLLDKS